MSTYITLLNWTQQGIENITDSPERLEKAQAAIEAAGGKMTAFYMTLGRYDMVAVMDAPNDAVFARILLAIAAQGGIRSETLKAFNQDEYKAIVSGLG